MMKRITTLAIIACSALSQSFASIGANWIKTMVFTEASGDTAQAQVSVVYTDGLGRERMSVSHGAGDGDADLWVRTDYDARGKKFRTWLPVPGGEELLRASSHEKAAETLYGSGEIPYTRYLYEENPIGRLTAEYGPGKLWAKNPTTSNWKRNTEDGIYSCQLIRVADDGTLSISGAYSPGSLRVTETTDADGLKTISFETRADKTILIRKIGIDETVADTRMVYDVMGDLRYAISPEGCRLLPSIGSVDTDITDKYAQYFEYDLWHRQTVERMPGCDASEFVYDKLGNLIFSSDAVQRQRGEWTLLKYDRNFRPAICGTVSLPGATRASLQQEYGDTILIEDFLPQENILESKLLYTDNSGPKGFAPYIAWYYDNYDFMQFTNSSQKQIFASDNGEKYTQTGMCTGSARSDGSNIWFIATRYDHRGKPLRVSSWDCWLQSWRITTLHDYDFRGNETRCDETVESMSEGTVMQKNVARTECSYDRYGRLLIRTLAINEQTPVTITDNKYDTIGRPSGNNAGPHTTFNYDIRSHLTSIESTPFTQRAWYGNTNNGREDKSFVFVNSLHSQWNFDGDNSFDLKEELYYDSMGHLICSQNDKNDLAEKSEVDLDANVVSIERRYQGDIIQDAAMSMNGEKVIGVNDVSTPYWNESVGRFPAGSYTLAYDSSGRLTVDETRDIKSVTYYSWDNLPKRITFGNGDYIHNTYLSDGTLLSRQTCIRRIETVTKVNSSGDTIRTSRNRDIVTTHNYLGSFEKIGNSWRYHTPEGYYDITAKKHWWYVRDRLGSTVAVVDGDGTISQATGYYPSGTPWKVPCPDNDMVNAIDEATDRLHISNKFISGAGLNWYDNTARMHDPLLMRFTSTDPKATHYFGISPWTHCGANPSNLVDTDGESTNVAYIGNNLYKVIGGNISDGDRNIYVVKGLKNGKPYILGQTATLKSFYSSDGERHWHGTINTKDLSGEVFLKKHSDVKLHKYIPNARSKKEYDFKARNEKTIPEAQRTEYHYRGMPVKLPGMGTVFMSARDIGNYLAGYVAAKHGIPWSATFYAFYLYENIQSRKNLFFHLEDESSTEAQKLGWKNGKEALEYRFKEEVSTMIDNIIGYWR